MTSQGEFDPKQWLQELRPIVEQGILNQLQFYLGANEGRLRHLPVEAIVEDLKGRIKELAEPNEVVIDEPLLRRIATQIRS